MKFLKNLFLVLLCIGAVGGVISIIESRNSDEPASYEENNNSNNKYQDDYYDNSYDNGYNNNYNENYNDNYNNNNGTNTSTGTSFREQGQANRDKVQGILNKVNSGSNSSSNNSSQQNNQQNTQQNSSQQNNQSTGGVNTTTKPNTNTNNSVVTKPHTGGTSKPAGQRVPLDTTGDYDDIVLTGSDRNDIVMMNINKNKDNLLSSLTGYEEPLKAAVGIFNAHKYEDIDALKKYYYNGKTNTDLTGDSMEYVAYKIVEYHKFSQQETDEVEKSARITMGIDDNSEITGYYRITMRVYQSKNREISIIKDETRYPFYFTITLIEVDGIPYEYISLTRR